MDLWFVGVAYLLVCGLWLLAATSTGQDPGTLISVPYSFQFDFPTPSPCPTCPSPPTGFNLTIAFQAGGFIGCHDDVNLPIGVEIGNTLDSDNIYYMIQVSLSACVSNDPNDPTNCFPGSNPAQTQDITGYVYIQDIYAGKIPGTKDTLKGSFLTPAAGVTVFQQYIVAGIENFSPFALSDNFVTFCVIVQSYDPDFNNPCSDIPPLPDDIAQVCYK